MAVTAGSRRRNIGFDCTVEKKAIILGIELPRTHRFCLGQLTISGTRISVELILDHLAAN
ncbi:MAG: DUF433 domain-containing protein [Nitrosomonas sp.]|nr:DUF433 domain-containing protein [Nitrosomonas sp.]